MAITADAIVDLFEKDSRARRRLAELLASEPDIRLAIINAVLRDVATKGDIEKIRNDIEEIRGEYATREDVRMLRSDVDKISRDLTDVRERLSKLEGIVSQLVERMNDFDKRIDSLDKRIDALDKRMDYVAKVSWTLTVSVIATLIANIILTYLSRFIH